MSLVLDSSVTLAWLYSDEITEPIRRIFEAVAEHGAVAPTLWRVEIANSLTVAVRRGRIDKEFRHAALSDLATLEITMDPRTDTNAWGQTLQFADQFGLTVSGSLSYHRNLGDGPGPGGSALSLRSDDFNSVGDTLYRG